MIPEPILDAVPLWALLLGAAAVLWLAMEGGYRIGSWRHSQKPDEREQPVGAIVASILGLLALVLGFTFSLAASRFDGRRQAVLEEANAVGTTFLRARLLPEPERTESLELLREYVEVRLRAPEKAQTAEAIARSEEIHQLLWAQAGAAAAKNEESNPTHAFIESLNELIELHARRIQASLRNRIPVVIWAGLYGLAMLGMVAVGYQCGLSTTRRSPAMLALVLAFSLVLFLIADLDRGQEGLLRVSQQAMLDVQQMMQHTP